MLPREQRGTGGHLREDRGAHLIAPERLDVGPDRAGGGRGAQRIDGATEAEQDADGASRDLGGDVDAAVVGGGDGAEQRPPALGPGGHLGE